MTSCPVCIEPYNKTKRFGIKCDFCDYISCRSCYQQYILQQSEPKCMNCFKVMTRDVLVNKFTKNWINNEYKFYRENILFNMEKAMLPATQPIVEREIEVENTHKILAELREQAFQLKKTILFYEDRIRNSHYYATEKKLFVRKCPNTECRGFLSTQWKCNLCDRKTCKDCNECIIDEHKCDPNSVETVKLLEKDSKPCPKCGEIIFKIDGCDQMFCTQCHSAFSWKTGRVDTGTVHNPHYFEWLKLNNKSIENTEMKIQCGREIDNNFIRQSRSIGFSSEAIDLCRRLVHFRHVELPRFTTHHFADNRDLRVSYLRNRISEEEFKITLQKRDKARQKKLDFYRLFSMMIQCVTEIIYRYYDSCSQESSNSIDDSWKMPRNHDKSFFEDFFSEIKELINYVNIQLLNISKIYNCKRYTITHNLLLENK